MKILEALTESTESKQEKQAKRLANKLKREQQSLISSLEDTRDNLLNQKEDLESPSMKDDLTNWVTKYQNVKQQLLETTVKLTIANETLKDRF